MSFSEKMSDNVVRFGYNFSVGLCCSSETTHSNDVALYFCDFIVVSVLIVAMLQVMDPVYLPEGNNPTDLRIC
ncbi:hypothetical protein K8353_50630, partial [Burkholderia contaminans]|nr:hypothetical protein [Burkholderia contaminans]